MMAIDWNLVGMHMVDFGAWAFPCGTNGGLRSRLIVKLRVESGKWRVVS